MTTKFLLLSSLLLLGSLSSSAQKKKVVYLDTLGNVIDIQTSISIRNTGHYKWFWDESNDKIRYIKPVPTSHYEFDSILTATEAKILLNETIGDSFDYFDLTDINGVQYSANELANKILVINFWFVGCGPCEVEMPELNSILKKYRSDKEVLFISFAKSKESKIKRFLERTEFLYPVIVLNEQHMGSYNIEAYPTNFIIDSNGQYVFASQGISPGGVTLLENYLKRTLNK